MRGRSTTVAVAIALCLMAASCSTGSHNASRRQIGQGVHITGPALPDHPTAIVAAAMIPPVLVPLSKTFQLGPSGPLAQPATVTLPLDAAPPVRASIAVATEATTTGPWSLIPATLSADGKSVTFTTTHFSIFSVIWVDARALLHDVETEFVDILDSGATGSSSPPSCDGQPQARGGGYSIASSTTDTIYWCFGTSGNSRVLKVVDNRRYPLEIAHPDLSVSDAGGIDLGSWSELARIGSRSYTFLAPGAQVSFAVNLPAGSVGGIETQMDGLGQSLYALQVGLQTLATILTRFGFGDSSAVSAASLLGDSGCFGSLQHGVIAAVSACLSPNELYHLFGTKALVVIPLTVGGSLVAFVHSELNALVDQFNHHDNYTVRIVRAAAPTSTSTTMQPPAPSGSITIVPAGDSTCYFGIVTAGYLLGEAITSGPTEGNGGTGCGYNSADLQLYVTVSNVVNCTDSAGTVTPVADGCAVVVPGTPLTVNAVSDSGATIGLTVFFHDPTGEARLAAITPRLVQAAEALVAYLNAGAGQG